MSFMADEKAIPLQRTEPTNDENLLASLGYKQEFKRDFSRLELASLCLSIVGVVQSIAAVLLFSLPYAGLVGMVWGWFTCSFFLIFVALAMAELGSAAPTAGGLYYWTFSYSSPKYRKVVAWLIGYMNTSAYAAGMASVDWSVAQQIMAAVNIGTDGKFFATTAQLYGLFAAILLIHATLASLGTKVIARLQYFYVFLNIALFLVVIIVLPASTPKELHNTPSFVFGQFQNQIGWPNGYAFILSFLAPAWSVGAFDASVHISEEARNAPRAVPFAMISATVLGCILGWIVNIVLAFYMGSDLDSVIDSPIQQPMATIFFNSVGKSGTLAIWAFMILALWMSGMDYLIAGSRQLFAFSRDRALPLSGFLYKINPHTQTPVHAVGFLAFAALLLGLLAFAGPLAISAVFTMSIVCQYLCYTTPIIARFVGGQKFTPGPFSLGRLGAPVAFIASAYMIFMIIVFLFPPAPGPTSQSMNYTVVVVGGTLILSLIYYYFPKYGGVYWFSGPVETIDHIESDDDSSNSMEK